MRPKEGEKRRYNKEIRLLKGRRLASLPVSSYKSHSHFKHACISRALEAQWAKGKLIPSALAVCARGFMRLPRITTLQVRAKQIEGAIRRC